MASKCSRSNQSAGLRHLASPLAAPGIDHHLVPNLLMQIKKKPSTDFMERIQKDINASMRVILVDWLVEVAEEYRLVPDTLYLTVNYIDRYLSVNAINKQRLQLLGVACMMIAVKYEEICAPQVEEFCYITDNTYFREEVLQMEAAVLRYLKFEMTAPTAKCFLRRFVRAAQASNEVPMLQLEFLVGYLAELSLLEYNMLCYSPSLIAASAIFLAKFVLQTSKRPWKQKLALAKQLNLRPRQVEVWFQNRRARTKLKQTEVDCEFLKRCCENLTEENRRLQKEVQELRALKLSPQMYMHMTPPTTLTMCPSCQRVAVSLDSHHSHHHHCRPTPNSPHWPSLPQRT